MSVAQAHKEVFGRLYHSVWNERRFEFIEKVIAKSHALGDPTLLGWGCRTTGVPVAGGALPERDTGPEVQY